MMVRELLSDNRHLLFLDLGHGYTCACVRLYVCICYMAQSINKKHAGILLVVRNVKMEPIMFCCGDFPLKLPRPF